MATISDMTVAKVREFVSRSEPSESLVSLLLEDKRASVKSIARSVEKAISERLKLIEKSNVMNSYENMLRSEGFNFICGIDEVGRGPLAGPVVASAVILDPLRPILGLDDSKKLSAKKREMLFDEIMEKAVAVSIGMSDNFVIDDINILNATKEAMKEAVLSLEIKPDSLLIDAVSLNLGVKEVAIIKGDEKSNSIAAASIIAKVTRDRMMQEYHVTYPEYGFDSNKGYGSASHMNALRNHGLTPIHRKSFLKKMEHIGK